MSKSLLEYIRKNTLFAGEKGKSVSWRCNINQLYNNWSKVAGLESQLKSRDSINQYKCSIGVLKNAGLMINKSNQILDSFRNPEETIRVITTLAHSINGDGSPSIDILNSKDNTTLRSLKTLLNILKRFVGIKVHSPLDLKLNEATKFKKKSKLYDWTISRIPQKRWGDPNEVSNLICFLFLN